MREAVEYVSPSNTSLVHGSITNLSILCLPSSHFFAIHLAYEFHHGAIKCHVQVVVVFVMHLTVLTCVFPEFVPEDATKVG